MQHLNALSTETFFEVDEGPNFSPHMHAQQCTGTHASAETSVSVFRAMDRMQNICKRRSTKKCRWFRSSQCTVEHL